MYLITKNLSKEDFTKLIKANIAQKENVLRKKRSDSAKAELEECQEILNKNLRPNIINIFGPTWSRISHKFPEIKAFKILKEAEVFLNTSPLLSNEGSALYEGKEVTCSFIAKYGGTKKRIISKITDSSIYFEGISIPIPIKDTHRISC